jgi:hypothetical protein
MLKSNFLRAENRTTILSEDFFFELSALLPANKTPIVTAIADSSLRKE